MTGQADSGKTINSDVSKARIKHKRTKSKRKPKARLEDRVVEGVARIPQRADESENTEPNESAPLHEGQSVPVVLSTDEGRKTDRPDSPELPSHSRRNFVSLSSSAPSNGNSASREDNQVAAEGKPEELTIENFLLSNGKATDEIQLGLRESEMSQKSPTEHNATGSDIRSDSLAKKKQKIKRKTKRNKSPKISSDMPPIGDDKKARSTIALRPDGLTPKSLKCPPSASMRGRQSVEPRKERSDSIRFIQERTASRSSVSTSQPTSRRASLVRRPSGLCVRIPTAIHPERRSDAVSPALGQTDGDSPVVSFPRYDEAILENTEVPLSQELKSSTEISRSFTEQDPVLALRHASALKDESTVASAATSDLNERPPTANNRCSAAKHDARSISTHGSVIEESMFADCCQVPNETQQSASKLNPLADHFSPALTADLALSLNDEVVRAAQRPCTCCRISQKEQHFVHARAPMTKEQTAYAQHVIESQEFLEWKVKKGISSSNIVTGNGVDAIAKREFHLVVKERAPAGRSQLISSPSTSVGGSKMPAPFPPLANSSFQSIKFRCYYCEKICEDTDESTLLCLGCGPFSPVRYCSEKHRLFDQHDHWQICGQIPFTDYVDIETLDTHYRYKHPAIQNIHEFASLENHRQRHFSMYNHDDCDYVIFDDWTRTQRAGFEVRGGVIPSHEIFFMKGDPVKDIFNRVLNVCFLDHALTRPLDLLYRLIRSELRRKGKWDSNVENELCHQFWLEFQLDPRSVCASADLNLKDEWNGSGGLEATISTYERNYPIVRMWRREHPAAGAAQDPWARYKGAGFADANMGGRDGHCGLGWEGCPPEPTRRKPLLQELS
ncbi:MAG: hypothetical protein M1837_005885 [Sclerophora amabilis]|nr:MAG: hypothetical protein M1837_005885 [Sclerophora amabilis]